MAKVKLAYVRGTGILSPVDVHAGARLRVRRTLLGMTQTSLGDAIGLTFQQVQKYERGMDRMTSSRLYDLARVLDVPVQHFFDDMPAAVAAGSPTNTKRGRAKKPPSYESDIKATQETIQLVRAYNKIRDPEIRKRLRELAKALGAGEDG